MSAIFVTAVGTDIGKTFVTAGLIRYLCAQDRPVDAIKPVATGFDLAAVASSDPGVLLTALQQQLTPVALDRIAPWRFTAPLSPDMAAAHESRALPFGKLVEFTRNTIRNTKGMLLIEGIGGVMVPLDETHTVLDWMAALGLPVLLVTGSYLGSLSHALTAFHALHSKALIVKAVVVNESLDSTVALDDTAATLRHFVETTPVVTLPRLASGQSPHPAFGTIAALL